MADYKVPRGAISAALWTALFLMFCGWVLICGGLSGLQVFSPKGCVIQQYHRYYWVELPIGVNSCGKVFRWLWWSWAFEVVMWFFACWVALSPRRTHRTFGLGILALLATCTVLVMWVGNVALDLLDAFRGAGDQANLVHASKAQKERARVLFAGSVIGGVGNGCVMLALGSLAGRAFVDDDEESAPVPVVPASSERHRTMFGRRREEPVASSAIPTGTTRVGGTDV